ncbi:cytochrome c [Tropicimonas sp. IMCC34011]|uniref:cytochrome c n=1 Tax=Tropicimonas sp. IMCC34011 TaxID=2248759 RepID=UPI000E22FF2C|nr:cytochrome c [Tropicimonas sp. IMCC34011]
MKKLLLAVLLIALIVVAGGLWLTRTKPLAPEATASLDGDAEAGALIFAAGGCASCHGTEGGSEEDRLILAGGHAIDSDFGTFYTPNISPSEAGIGGWSLEEFADAMVRGVSPEGQHYYPAFPYVAYSRMELQDVADLWAYMQTLPESDTASRPHDLPFPFNVRRGLGLWKLRYMPDGWVMTGEDIPERGRYLVEAVAHCGECHTSRDELGGLITVDWLGGAPNPSGEGSIPNITPGALDWSAEDIAYYLESGFTPDFDTAGGSMVDVIHGTSQLPAKDREAIADYVKAVPAVE